jgi:NADH-quinone oxidoreductase subunit M
MQQIADLKTHEILAAGLLVASIVLFGLLPAPLIELSAATITRMNDQISQRLL